MPALPDRLAFAGMVLSIVGVASFLPFLGIFAFAAPVAGRLYLNGQENAVSVIAEATSASNLSALVFGVVFFLVPYMVGLILFGVAIWRCGKLPKWSALPYTISTSLNATPHYISAIWFLDGILLFVAGIGIAWGIWKSLMLRESS